MDGLILKLFCLSSPKNFTCCKSSSALSFSIARVKYIATSFPSSSLHATTALQA